MCGRFVITSPPAAVRLAFGYSDQPNFPARYNIAPTQPIPVVILDNGARRFRLMRWGLIPSWVKDPRQFSLLINARSETVLDKPAFRNAMKRRRCLVPADGYYEWQSGGKPKQPYFIHPADGAPLGLAGVAETWVGPNGEELDTVAIVTTAASQPMAVLHDRVPVTIAPGDYARWLDCAEVSAEEAATLLHPPAEGALRWHPVSTAVNRVANDDAQLILPIAVGEPAPVEPPKPAKAAAASRRAAKAVSGDDGQGSLF
ncbi:putative SOS response-associated peptidase YedK [Rhodopseudomonas rhenobacensis]|uniref:Abasic site processing protein n=1 Tax=Rhodopseudomonas rhenobacensis TaxID=87461 RepID=A0A7W7Z2B7_9BRAD|nr:SOS response-associated peptidase [Rhodopseudomonas rhenobacensis]MBB5046733.1 putative SOS response-associated peptidase YedK [Rhodopseudomonas rhenobacensis]